MGEDELLLQEAQKAEMVLRLVQTLALMFVVAWARPEAVALEEVEAALWSWPSWLFSHFHHQIYLNNVVLGFWQADPLLHYCLLYCDDVSDCQA